MLQGDLRDRDRAEQIEMLRERYDRLAKDLDGTNELDALEVFLDRSPWRLTLTPTGLVQHPRTTSGSR